MKHMLAASLVCGALALGTIGSAAAASRLPATPAASTFVPGSPQSTAGIRNPGRATLALLVKATADLSSLTVADIGKQLANSKSLAQIAQEHGTTADAVLQAARATLKTRLDTAVKNGKLTQARADATLAEFDAAAPAVLQQVHPVRQQRQQQANQQQARRLRAALVKATADVTGMTVKDVAAELKTGKSLAQIAQEHGKTVDDILA
ncbi:MAG TPA: hypothetical protein VFT99_08480, partial [Roseiflexaceae bacterium]|nr:hypothetical protein [Roseiflexaceae bacterium]